MNSVHDLGGTRGLGPVHSGSTDEAPFHYDWERRIFGVQFVALAHQLLKLDEARYATELMDPVGYLSCRYYERWMANTETLLVDKEILSWEDIDRRAAEFLEDPDRAMPRLEVPGIFERVQSSIENGVSDGRRVGAAPRFAVGDVVKTRRYEPEGHTRLPGYARDRTAVVERVLGAFVLPDANAHGLGERPEHTYQIRLEGDELWGSASEPRSAVYLDVWESYLQRTDRPSPG